MKFATRFRGAAVGVVLAGILGHILLKAGQHSVAFEWTSSTLLAAGIFFLALLAYVGLHLFAVRARGRETLEIGRRGFTITEPHSIPFALAWRMIREADLVQEDCWRWRFRLKNGNEVSLIESAFTREVWKKLSVQLERKLKAKNIPVRVIGAGQAPEA